MYTVVWTIRLVQFQPFHAISHICRRDDHHVQLEVDMLVSREMRKDRGHVTASRQPADGDAARINVERLGVAYCPFDCIPAVVYAGWKGKLGRHPIVYIDDFDVGFVAHVPAPGGFTLQTTKHPTTY
jgi:hypothetical protein